MLPPNIVPGAGKSDEARHNYPPAPEGVILAHEPFPNEGYRDSLWLNWPFLVKAVKIVSAVHPGSS